MGHFRREAAAHLVLALLALSVLAALLACGCGAGGAVATPPDDVVTIPLATAAPSASAVAITPDPPLTSPPPRPKRQRYGDLDGAIIRIVYTAAREEDAKRVEQRLTDYGAKIIMALTSDSGNEPHLGKLYVESKRFADRSELIVSIVADVEALTPEPDSLSDEVDFNLWVARPP